MTDLPRQAKIVIIGGGIVGCSTAYHLGKLGVGEVVLVERHKLTSGSTFHAAGLVGQLRTSANITQLLGHSVALYKSLEAETGLATGWKQSGGLRLACTQARWTELRRQATTARSFGLEVQLLTPAEAYELWPAMNIDDLVGAVFLPTDGQANPSDITQSLAKGARMAGVRIVEDTEITDVKLEGGRIVGVDTDRGFIKCETVVNCAGQWAREIGKLANVNVPLVSVEHQYIVTEPIPGLPRNLPTLRDPDRLTYYKEEVGGLVMGGYEPNPIPWAVRGIPKNFQFQLLQPNWDHFQPLMEQSIARVPLLQTAGVRDLINGPESFTPDGNFILGEAPELRNFFVGAGFNAFGIAAGGGAGMVLAEWIARGEPPFDIWPVDIRRFSVPHRDADWVRARTLELYAKHYTVAWPGEEHGSARGLRRSPLYSSLKAARAVFGEKAGWERPNWFTGETDEPRDIYSFTQPNWVAGVAREHRACRGKAVLFDQSSFAKAFLVGRDAESTLNWICANDVAKPPGSLTYTQMLNARGGIECDLTVARLDRDKFYVVTGTAFATHDFGWIARNIPAGADARLIEVTSGYATLALMGPNARSILQSVAADDVSNAAFPFGQIREISVAGAPTMALRVTYVGELGWELHLPTEFAASVYEAIVAAGMEFGLVNGGYRAIETLRLEKGYRAWGSDIGPDYTPLEAGLGWAVKLKRDIPFLGRGALLAARDRPLTKKLMSFTVEPDAPPLLGRETILRDGLRVGWLASGGYGHTVEKGIGLGYVRRSDGIDDAWLREGRYELEIATERFPAEIHFQPLYDPAGSRIRV